VGGRGKPIRRTWDTKQCRASSHPQRQQSEDRTIQSDRAKSASTVWGGGADKKNAVCAPLHAHAQNFNQLHGKADHAPPPFAFAAPKQTSAHSIRCHVQGGRNAPQFWPCGHAASMRGAARCRRWRHKTATKAREPRRPYTSTQAPRAPHPQSIILPLVSSLGWLLEMLTRVARAPPTNKMSNSSSPRCPRIAKVQGQDYLEDGMACEHVNCVPPWPPATETRAKPHAFHPFAKTPAGATGAS
jgi:hypothetical protein